MENLVKGYMVRTNEMLENGKEQLFALYDNGEIKTCIKNYSSLFKDKRVKWKSISEMPQDAHFIGKYKML